MYINLQFFSPKKSNFQRGGVFEIFPTNNLITKQLNKTSQLFFLFISFEITIRKINYHYFTPHQKNHPNKHATI